LLLLIFLLAFELRCILSLILITKNHIISLFILFKLLLNLLDLLLLAELRALFEFVGDEEGLEWIGFLSLEVLVDVLHLLVGRDAELYLRKLRALLLHEDYREKLGLLLLGTRHQERNYYKWFRLRSAGIILVCAPDARNCWNISKLKIDDANGRRY
jgi:hypothetical protein